MSVRNSLLAILTMGDAYGFQLHGELDARTAGRRQVNVGQIYSTLERLVVQGAVESAGSTPDGLPLYRLTALGHSEALTWLHGTHSATGDDWDEMVERILIASSLPQIDVIGIVHRYREDWTARLVATGPGPANGQVRLAAAAAGAQARAALDWLDTVGTLLQESISPSAGHDSPAFHREFSSERPKRGRRPSLATAG